MTLSTILFTTTLTLTFMKMPSKRVAKDPGFLEEPWKSCWSTFSNTDSSSLTAAAERKKDKVEKRVQTVCWLCSVSLFFTQSGNYTTERRLMPWKMVSDWHWALQMKRRCSIPTAMLFILLYKEAHNKLFTMQELMKGDISKKRRSLRCSLCLLTFLRVWLGRWAPTLHAGTTTQSNIIFCSFQLHSNLETGNKCGESTLTLQPYANTWSMQTVLKVLHLPITWTLENST